MEKNQLNHPLLEQTYRIHQTWAGRYPNARLMLTGDLIAENPGIR